jgi:hypothetical protein
MAGAEDTQDTARYVEVPHGEVAPEVLRRLVEEFVTRDGTDYGAIERTLDQKCAAVLRQLERGEAMIVFDAESESVHIAVRPAPPRGLA